MKYMVELKAFKKPCIMLQDDEYGKNVLDGFTQQLAAMKIEPATETSYKRGAIGLQRAGRADEGRRLRPGAARHASFARPSAP